MIDQALRESWEVLTIRLRAFLGRRLPAADVDDAVQDVLMKIHQHVRSLDDESRFGPWVYRVARNAAIDRLRRRSPDTVEVEALDAVPAVPGDADEERPLVDCVAPFVARLPEAYRHAITLVELQGLTQAEAARMMGVSLSGMKSRVQRGRRELREMLEACCALTFDARGAVVDARQHGESGCGGCAPGTDPT